MLRRNRYVIFTAIGIIVLILAALIIPRLKINQLAGSYVARIEGSLRGSNNFNQNIDQQALSLAKLDAVQKDNEKLRQALNFFQQYNYQYVLAYRLARDPLNQNLITLSAGRAEGVNVGQPIVVQDGIIIGKILSVEEHKSLAELLSADQSRLLVAVATNKGTSGLLVGSLGTSLKLQYIPNELTIAPNDVVITSGLELLVPAGLVVGRIDTIEVQQNEIFKYAKINPSLDYQQQYLVSIITGNQ